MYKLILLGLVLGGCSTPPETPLYIDAIQVRLKRIEEKIDFYNEVRELELRDQILEDCGCTEPLDL